MVSWVAVYVVADATFAIANDVATDVTDASADAKLTRTKNRRFNIGGFFLRFFHVDLGYHLHVQWLICSRQ